MLRYILTFWGAAIIGCSFGQTGNGLVLLTSENTAFPPTPVDSTHILEVQLINTVGAEQTAYFGGLSSPFGLVDAAPLAIAAGDTVTIGLTFNPLESGNQSDTLTVVGSVFGSAQVALSGLGTQIEFDYGPASLTFDTTAVGAESNETIALANTGVGNVIISDYTINNPAFTLDVANTSFVVAEGQNGFITVDFNPSSAGLTSGALVLYTNSPTSPIVTIPLTAVGISEVSGEVCGAVWDLNGSPYILTGNVQVPQNCSLTIEPGVEVYCESYNINVTGDLIANGLEAEPITFVEGVLDYNQGDAAYLQHCRFLGPENIYHLLYYNNFELADYSQYDFDGIRPDNGSTGTGTATSANNMEFYRWNSGGWANQEFGGSHLLRYYSWDIDTYIYLADTLFAPSTGVYEMSFTYESDRYEYNCEMRIEGYVDGAWTTLYTSPKDIESNSSLTRVARGSMRVDEGDPILFRIFHDIWSSGVYDDEMYTYLDEVKVQSKQALKSKTSWDFSQAESAIESISAASYNNMIQVVDDTIRIAHTGWNCVNVDFNTTSFPQAPIIVPEDGWYSIEVRYEKPVHQRQELHLYYKSDLTQTGWNWIIQEYNRYGGNGGYVYPWHTEEVRTVAALQAGERLDFRFYVKGSWCQSLTANIASINLVKRQDGAIAPEAYLSGVLTERDLDMSHVTSTSLATKNCAVNASHCEIATVTSESSDFHSMDGLHEQILAPSTVVRLNRTDVIGSSADAVLISGTGRVNMAHSRLLGSEGGGLRVNTALSDSVNVLDHCVFGDNGLEGVQSGSPINLNFCTIANNGGEGVKLGNLFAEIQNSILWNNDGAGGTQLYSEGLVSGGYNIIKGLDSYGTNGITDWTGGMSSSDPLFADLEFHLQPYSPAVDAGMPWLQDAYMPYGLGGLRADMGAYGGPDNADWGGAPAPDGAVELLATADAPQDQGNLLGLVFSSSPFDQVQLNSVTSYSIWRHFDPTGNSIAEVNQGNWELVGDMPAQGFGQYAYQAPTLGNTNVTGPFQSCYTIVSNTDDPSVYWFSKVMCGEAVDNLAPAAPIVEGESNEEGDVVLSWEEPGEEDYAYTSILRDGIWIADVATDTLLVDNTPGESETYSYTFIHNDVNGNASSPALLEVFVENGRDIIPLAAGWNLISLDRLPANNDVAALMAELIPGNLQYVTGFNGGATLYDPAGPSFLNTLQTFDAGYGYWVKVAQADTLRVEGDPLAPGFLPAFDAGWNLIGYTSPEPVAPANFFSGLINSEELIYVTGFDGGLQVFDPNGLAFLNTLVALQNGFGYWVKTSPDYAGMDIDDSNKNCNFQFLQGTSNLEGHAGETVDITDATGAVFGTIAILEGGMLGTTALYGDDPATSELEGIPFGTELHFALNGVKLNGTVLFEGAMALSRVHLVTEETTPTMQIMPNPIGSAPTLALELPHPGSLEITWFDPAGKRVKTTLFGHQPAGAFRTVLETENLGNGPYQVSALLNGEPFSQTSVLKQD